MNSTAAYDAEFMHDLGVIAEDESLVRRLVKYVRRLAQSKPDPTLMTREEFFARVDEAREEIRRGEGVTFTNVDDMNAWLNSL